MEQDNFHRKDKKFHFNLHPISVEVEHEKIEITNKIKSEDDIHKIVSIFENHFVFYNLPISVIHSLLDQIHFTSIQE